MHASNNLVSVIFLTGKKCGKRCFFLSSFERFKNGKKIIREGGGGGGDKFRSRKGNNIVLFFPGFVLSKGKKKKKCSIAKVERKILVCRNQSVFPFEKKNLVSKKNLIFNTSVY